MASVNQISGDDASNTLRGTSDADLIYGFDPNDSTASVSSIAATRVATGLSQPVAAVAAPGDSDHLFIIERTGAIQVADLRSETNLRSETTGSFVSIRRGPQVGRFAYRVFSRADRSGRV